MSSPLRYTLLIITAGLLVFTTYKSYSLSNKNGGTDLRCRVVASRLLATDHSPYFYKWNPPDGEFFLDPNDRATRLVNGNVVTPAVLYVTYPVSVLPYSVVRPLWTTLQFIACFAFFLLLLYKHPRTPATIAAIVGICGLVCSNTWLSGIERGQMYIFYALFFALMYRLYISGIKYNEFLSGITGGLFIFFRPFAGIVMLGFLLQGKINWLKGWVTGLIIGACLFVLLKPSLWTDYFTAMKEYTYEVIGQRHGNPQAINPIKPAVIEGMNTLTSYARISAGKMSPIYGYFRLAGFRISYKQSILLYGAVVLFLTTLFILVRKKNPRPPALFLFGFLLYVLAEIFTIAPRASYNVIQWLFPITIISLYIRPATPLFIGLIAALLLLCTFPFIEFPYQGELAELMLMGVTFVFIFFPGWVKKWQYGHSRI